MYGSDTIADSAKPFCKYVSMFCIVCCVGTVWNYSIYTVYSILPGEMNHDRATALTTKCDKTTIWKIMIIMVSKKRSTS